MLVVAVSRCTPAAGHLGACVHGLLNCRISPHKNVTEKPEKERGSDEKKTSRWLFLWRGALPTAGGAYPSASLPLHGLSRGQRHRVCNSCEHRNRGDPDPA